MENLLHRGSKGKLANVSKEKDKLLRMHCAIAIATSNHFIKLNKDIRNNAITNNQTPIFLFKKHMHPELTKLRQGKIQINQYSKLTFDMGIQMAQSSAVEAVDASIPRNSHKVKKGFPKYKSVHTMADNSITVPWREVGQKCFKGDKLIAFKMPKIGLLHPRGVSIPKGNQAKILSVTISKIANGWAVSVNYEKDKPVFKSAPEISIGIDLGINPLIAFSNGIKIDNPRWNKKQKKKLKRLARAVSRKKLRSKNRMKAQMRLNRVHQKITNQRKDFYHKLSYRLTETYQNIALEDLNIKALCGSHLSKSFGEAGLGILVNQLKYKAEEKGRDIHLYGRYDRSTGVCPIPKCGWKTPERLTLGIKEWTCGGCGQVHDRDIAAAQVVESAYTQTLGKPVPKVVKNALDNSNVISEGLVVPIMQEGNSLQPLRISETLLSLESEVS